MRRLGIRPSVGTTSVAAALPLKRASAARSDSSPESAASSSFASGDHAGPSPSELTGTINASTVASAGGPDSTVNSTLTSPLKLESHLPAVVLTELYANHRALTLRQSDVNRGCISDQAMLRSPEVSVQIARTPLGDYA